MPNFVAEKKTIDLMPTNTETMHGVRQRLRVAEPMLYDVILLNDDFTTMQFVVEILCNVFGHTSLEAEAIMLDVHNNGKGLAGTYTFDIAQSKADKTMQIARHEGFPLRLEVIEHLS